MDPVSVFNALYDTKCIKFNNSHHHNGISELYGPESPYSINLQRLPLFPKLMDAVVTQVVERFLSCRALMSLRLLPQTTQSKSSTQLEDNQNSKCDEQVTKSDSDTDSQLEEDEMDDSSSDNGGWEKICRHKLDPIICGVSTSAVPIASAIAYKAQLPYLSEWIAPKLIDSSTEHTISPEHLDDDTTALMCSMIGQQACNDHEPQNLADERQRVILVEDVILSGEQILDTVRAIERRNLKVEFIVCVVDCEENRSQLMLSQAGVRILPLYNISAILRVLETNGRITSEQFIYTRQWMAKNQLEAVGVVDNSKYSLTKFNQQNDNQTQATNTIQIAAT